MKKVGEGKDRDLNSEIFKLMNVLTYSTRMTH